MKVEDPAAFRFIINEDIYLLPHDKEVESKKVVKEAESVPFSFNYEGKNRKKFLILTHYPDHEAIYAVHFTALEAILSRKGYQTDDVAILNMARNDADINTLTNHFSPEKLLILGHKAIPVGMEEPQFNHSQAIGGRNTLLSFCFDDMMENTDNKRAFWEQMKNL
ncbi:hypothetical protein ACFQZS_17345 [Mucilaginibacter calamicampi]|uniref:Uncharacterized protein n=1 Tax=Mucilaginibacter calamicampi TaxID=1302352 RepID=A0ABW2YZW4_9SPHI